MSTLPATSDDKIVWDTWLAATAFSLLMLLGTKGRQYTFPELQDFLQAAGFVDAQALSTGAGYYSLVIATKP